MLIGLAYAMRGEIESILKNTNAKLLETACGVPIYEIEPGILAYAGGIGKVNAAMSTQLFIDRCHPDWIINAGVAGSFLDLPVGTVVLADSFVQHDVDTSAIGDPVGMVSTVNRVEFPTDGLERAEEILNGLGIEHKTGRVATGEVFMKKGERADWISKTFGAMLCEMEGGAIAQVCLRNEVKFTALKSVSDRLCQDNNAKEYFNFAEAMAKLNTIVLPFAHRLLNETKKENCIMERIASFQVNHNTLTPGLFLSRQDGQIVTFDLRFKKPNTGDLLTNAEMHSVEHVIATLLRNGRAKDAIIYFGPMGCQTGFYLLFDSSQLSLSDAVELVKETFAGGAVFDGPMPGKSPAECGNYINLDVDLAKRQCAYYTEIIRDWNEERLAYS